jgi:hypothetical protein
MVPPHHRQQGQGFHSVPDQIEPGKNWILQYKVHILHLCRKQILFLYQKQLRTVLQAEKMHPNLDASTMLRYLATWTRFSYHTRGRSPMLMWVRYRGGARARWSLMWRTESRVSGAPRWLMTPSLLDAHFYCSCCHTIGSWFCVRSSTSARTNRICTTTLQRTSLRWGHFGSFNE